MYNSSSSDSDDDIPLGLSKRIYDQNKRAATSLNRGELSGIFSDSGSDLPSDDDIDNDIGLDHDFDNDDIAVDQVADNTTTRHNTDSANQMSPTDSANSDNNEVSSDNSFDGMDPSSSSTDTDDNQPLIQPPARGLSVRGRGRGRLREFREALSTGLVGGRSYRKHSDAAPRNDDQRRDHTLQHAPQKMTTSVNCRIHMQRCETSYICRVCQVRMCPDPCFFRYHYLDTFEYDDPNRRNKPKVRKKMKV